jgi:Sulfotransferase domain
LKRAIHHFPTAPVGLALDRLQEIHQSGWNNRILFLRFEDLTSEPAKTTQQVYASLGLPEFEHNFEKVTLVASEDDQVYGLFGSHEIRSKG